MPHAIAKDETRLFYKDWGRGKPVVFIHGWPFSANMWDELAIAAVEAGCRAISYDRRGFGRSDETWDGYDYDTPSDDLASVMQAAGAEAATLVAFSMGGGEVARYMSRHGGRNVSAVVLVATIVPRVTAADDNRGGAPRADFEALKRAVIADRAATLRRQFLPGFFGIGTSAGEVISNELIDWAGATALAASLRATSACIDAIMESDFRADLSAFNVPVLLVHGDADVNVPIVSSRAAAGAIAGSRLVTYQGQPHAIMFTQRERLARDVLGFIVETE